MSLKELPHAAEGSLHASKSIEDGVIASSLITAPAWGPWLSELNSILTTISLILGLTIGLFRLWQIHKSGQRPERRARTARTVTTAKQTSKADDA